MKASPNEQAKLLDLQALDTKLRQLAYKGTILPQHAVIAELTKKIETLRVSELERRGSLEDVELELTRLQSDATVVDARIARDVERAAASSSAKDAQALEHELASLRKRQFDLEEIQLTVMERLEERAAELSETSTQLEELRAQVATAEAERDAELALLGSERTHTAANRATIAATVPAELLALYDKQASRYGTGASLLRGGVSSASGVKLLADEMVAIRAAAPDDVIICPSSDAILVRTAESGL
ncbi:MAG: zinc ribbon domain-containing protein [Microbacteriaceae bacterium]